MDGDPSQQNPLAGILPYLLMGAAGQQDPNASPAANLLNPGQLMRPILAMQPTLQKAGDYFTKPQGQYNATYGGGQAPGAPALNSPVNAWAAMTAANPPKDPNAGETINTGISAPTSLPPSPQMAPPVGVDTNELTKWLAMAEPKAPTADAQQGTLQNNILAGLAKGLMSGGSHQNILQTIGHLGGGGLAGAAEGNMENLAAQQKYQQAEQQYATMRAGNALDIAKMDTGQKNALAEVAFKNAMAQHQDALDQIALTQPKFLGMQGGIATYQQTQPDGKVQIKSFNTGLLQQQAIAKAMANHSAEGSGGQGGDVIRDLMAADLSPMNDPYGYFAMTAAELQNKGVLSTVLGDKNFQTLNTHVQQEVMAMPGDEKSKAQAYKQMLVGNAAGMLMNNPNLVMQASPYSIFARGLYPYLQGQNGR